MFRYETSVCQCSCGVSGGTNPVPFLLGVAFHGGSSPALLSTRYTEAGLTATTSWSSIMNVRRR